MPTSGRGSSSNSCPLVVSCSGVCGTNSGAKTLNTELPAAGGRSVVVLAASGRLSSEISLSLAVTAVSNSLASEQLARHKSFTRVFRLATLVFRLLTYPVSRAFSARACSNSWASTVSVSYRSGHGLSPLRGSISRLLRASVFGLPQANLQKDTLCSNQLHTELTPVFL